jgi:hypothetical protein
MGKKSAVTNPRVQALRTKKKEKEKRRDLMNGSHYSEVEIVSVHIYIYIYILCFAKHDSDSNI